MPDLRTTLADLVADLVDPYEHAETIQLRHAFDPNQPRQEIRIHRVRFPSLLEQLAMAVEPSGGIGTARGYESSPAASLDAIDCLAAIRTGAILLLGLYGGADRRSIAGNVRALTGLSVTEADLRAIVRVVREWVTKARLVTRWEVPARRLKEPCPACEVRGRIRVTLQPLEAECGDCGVTWIGDAEIAILAAHVHQCNGEPVTEGAAA